MAHERVRAREAGSSGSGCLDVGEIALSGQGLPVEQRGGGEGNFYFYVFSPSVGFRFLVLKHLPVRHNHLAPPPVTRRIVESHAGLKLGISKASDASQQRVRGLEHRALIVRRCPPHCYFVLSLSQLGLGFNICFLGVGLHVDLRQLAPVALLAKLSNRSRRRHFVRHDWDTVYDFFSASRVSTMIHLDFVPNRRGLSSPRN